MRGPAKADEVSEIIRHDQGQARGRARTHDEQLSPTEHESHKRSEAPGNIHVLSARAGHSRAELRVHQAADEHEKTRPEPEDEHRIERADIPCDDLGTRIDARTDADPDQDGDAVEDAQNLAQGGSLGSGLSRARPRQGMMLTGIRHAILTRSRHTCLSNNPIRKIDHGYTRNNTEGAKPSIKLPYNQRKIKYIIHAFHEPAIIKRGKTQ